MGFLENVKAVKDYSLNYICGNPGTGKTTILYKKAIEEANKGREIVIVNTEYALPYAVKKIQSIAEELNIDPRKLHISIVNSKVDENPGNILNKIMETTTTYDALFIDSNGVFKDTDLHKIGMALQRPIYVTRQLARAAR